jgi:LAO/AO transport system kinase
MSEGKPRKKPKSALHLMDGVEQPPQLNKDLLERIKTRKGKSDISIEKLFEGILNHDRVMLSKAITLVESHLAKHQDAARKLIEHCLPSAGKSVRIGVTGVPGVGKSTFIETLGMFLIEMGHKIAVLAVDPSSERSKGSILGDKTRMENLSSQKNAFIRPSPSAGTLGGVTRKTRETIILCEAAGYDIIFVETVGVGQSEVAVKSMVDFFLLLVLAGAGDELQGIKRGIMEMADAVVIHKADGDNLLKAQSKISMYQNALHFFPPSESGWSPKVTECSSFTGHHIELVWKMISDYIGFVRQNSFFDNNRQEQEVARMYQVLDEYLRNSFFQNPETKTLIKDFEKLIRSGKLTPYQAATDLVEIHERR